ncbi:MAG: DUF948 domain-containing protein [Actinobacteria bacterium]|nr:DUF948 domain-containing protein [Actinomycetota bacterium]
MTLALLAVSAGGVAAIVIAVGLFIVCLFLSAVLLNSFRVLESTKTTIDGVRDETVPLLAEVRTTVTNVNKELDRADGIVESTGNIIQSVERLTAVVEKTVSSPLVKLVAFSAGAAKAAKKFTGQE